MTVTSPGRFFGRSAVLSMLSGHLDAVVRGGTGRIVGVRGRRQVGKSTVVERFVDSAQTPHVFVTGVFGAPSRRQLEDATLAIAESRRPFADADVLAHSSASSWRDWFGRVAIAARSGPVIVVLDEFPWMAAAGASLEGELQVQWDRVLEKLPVLMILVGSDVAMMEALGSHGRPLFGRLHPLVVPALNPGEIAQALDGRSAFDVFDSYLITGGYPRLVSDLVESGAQTAGDYVRTSLLDVYSPLVATARFTLDAEFPEATAAYQVLSAIGSTDTANPGFSDLLSAMSDPADRKKAETAITRALRTLTEVKGLIERDTPAWAPSSRLRRYRVTDPYLRFWFRYVERNVERIARGRADLAVKGFDRDWSSWRGRSIEPVVREAIGRLAVTEPSLAGVESVQPWWVRDGSVEVDVVAATSKATAVVGTIKWRQDRGVSEREMDDLRRSRDVVPRADAASLAAISPNGGAPRGADLAFSAADLLAAWP